MDSGMMLAEVDIGPYEGLIFSTARRYAPFLGPDYEEDDIRQVLRVKVWTALRHYDARRSSQPVKAFVFSCVKNRVKDLLKEQTRRNTRRDGRQLFIEDMKAVDGEGRFERRYLMENEETAFAEVDDEAVALPSTLTDFEITVVRLLVLDFSQTEIHEMLNVSRSKVRTAHRSVQQKMADWHPRQAQLPQTAVAA